MPAPGSRRWRGGRSKRRNMKVMPLAALGETAIHDGLRSLGFDDRGIGRLLRRFSPPSIRLWMDVTLAAKERDGGAFIKKSPQAYLVDNLKNAAQGLRTPPDWWHDLRRTEQRLRPKAVVPPAQPTKADDQDLTGESRQAYERIAGEMFGVFCAAGQPGATARENAQKFARDFVRRPGVVIDKPLFG